MFLLTIDEAPYIYPHAVFLLTKPILAIYIYFVDFTSYSFTAKAIFKMKMKLIKQLDIVSLFLWCILSFNFIKSIDSILPCLCSIEGPVIYPDDSLFQPLIIDQNTRVNYTPSVLVYALNNKDVQKAVKCAVELR